MKFALADTRFLFGICYIIMKLLERVETIARQRRLAEATIAAYSLWIRQFLAFCAVRHTGWKHPRELGTADVEAFLNELVIARRLSASAQNQALCALVFLYGRVLGRPGTRATARHQGP